MDAFDMECEDVPGDPGPEGATLNTGGDVDEAMQMTENTAAAAGSIQMPGQSKACLMTAESIRTFSPARAPFHKKS